MPICDHSGLVSPVMLHVKNQVYLDLFVVARFNSAVYLKSLVLVQLGQLQIDGVLPFGIAVHFVKTLGFLVILRHLESIFVLRSGVVRPQLGLVDRPQELLGSLRQSLEPLPPFCLKEPFILGIYCTGDWVICCNDVEGFVCHGTIFPFQFDVVR